MKRPVDILREIVDKVKVQNVAVSTGFEDTKKISEVLTLRIHRLENPKGK